MQKAEAILQAIRKLGEQRAPLTRVYRALYSEDLYLAAYSKIYSNRGAMTPGTEDDTVDGMSLKRVRAIIDMLRYERFHFKAVRRTEIPKKRGKGKRKLGLPNFTDKLVQEVLRNPVSATVHTVSAQDEDAIRRCDVSRKVFARRRGSSRVTSKAVSTTSTTTS
jgi:hypothetical protein